MLFLTRNELSFESLSSLMSGSALALRVPAFSDRATCDDLARWSVEHGGRQPYGHEIRRTSGIEYRYYGVDRIGEPFNRVIETERTSPERRAYYDQAIRNIRRLRQAACGNLSPIDKLRLELDEVWPAGAMLARFEGKTMFCGIVRIMNALTSSESQIHPHYDELPEACYILMAQLAANVYVALPPTGGALEVWDVLSQADLSQGRPLTAPSLTIQPEVGDLVVFNSRRLHAIREFTEGVRISVQCFIGYTAMHEPLLLWD